MRKLSKQQRVGVICAGCAAIVPAAVLLTHRGGVSNPMEFLGGLVVGLGITLSIGMLVMRRRC
jgi:hypothetical protein